MGTEDRNQSDPLETIRKHVTAYEFFQVVHLLQRLRPDAEIVGYGSDPAREVVRFRSRTTFSFPASDVQRLSPPARAGGPEELLVNILGLATPGCRGALPVWYAAEVNSQKPGSKEGAPLRDFLDMFNHRLISFFYRTWEKYDFACQYQSRGRGFLHTLLYSILGFPSPALRQRLAFDERFLLRHFAVFARRPTTPDGLLDLLRDYFGLPVAVEPFVAEWQNIEPSDQLRLGSDRAALGIATTLGARVRLPQAKFRVRFGPLDYSQFCHLLPDGAMFAELVDIIRLAVGPEFEFDAQLVLLASAVPKPELREDRTAPRLGWSTWLGNRNTSSDAEETLVPLSRLEST